MKKGSDRRSKEAARQLAALGGSATQIEPSRFNWRLVNSQQYFVNAQRTGDLHQGDYGNHSARDQRYL